MSLTASGEGGGQPASGSSFFAAMRILPRERREAMLAIYGFCRAVDDIADEPSTSAEARLEALDGWRKDLDALYRGESAGRAAPLCDAARGFRLDLRDFLAVIDGMEMDVRETIRAPSAAVLDLYCDRVASAVGRLSVRIFGLERQAGISLSHHLGRALQLTNILRDLDDDAAMGRLYLSREALAEAGVSATSPAEALADPHLPRACAVTAELARRHFAEAAGVMDGCPRSLVRAPRMMADVYLAILDRLCARGWSPPRVRVRAPRHRIVLALLRRGLF